MPNYTYRCNKCDTVYEVTLPMSHDPKLLFACEDDWCEGECKRVILHAPQFKGFKVWAGDWFKKTYGHDIGEVEMTREEFRRDLKKAEQLAKKDGVNINQKHTKKLEGG